MKIDDKLITYLEDLSNMTLTADEKSHLIEDLQKTLNSMAQFSTLDTNGVPESIHPFDYANVFREDEYQLPFGRDLILQNAPEHNNETFIAPKTVE